MYAKMLADISLKVRQNRFDLANTFNLLKYFESMIILAKGKKWTHYRKGILKWT